MVAEQRLKPGSLRLLIADETSVDPEEKPSQLQCVDRSLLASDGRTEAHEGGLWF